MAPKAQRELEYNHELIMSAGAGENGETREYKIAGVAGLTLTVTKAGTGTYYCRYQVMEGGKKRFRRQKIGRRDRVKLKDAKAKAQLLIGQVEKGEDPVAAKQALKGALTLRQLFEERATTDKETSARTLNDYRQVLTKHVFPRLGDHAAASITEDQFAKVLRAIEKDAPHSAHKAQSALGSTYKWARQKGLAGVKSNPVKELGFIVASKPRERVLTDDELAKLWSAFDAPEFSGGVPVKRILKLAVLLGQRNTEITGARKTELRDLEGENPLWRIPPDRMKRRREHFVPLSKQAAAIFRAALKDAGEGEYVFPGSTHGRQQNRSKHIARGTVSNNMSDAIKLAGLTDVRVHDQRKQLTTWLAENQYAGSAVLDAILHHAPQGVTDKFYNFAKLEKPVRVALQQWADHVWTITGQS